MNSPGIKDLPPEASFFEAVRWKDPITGIRLIPIITSRNPSGVPLSGAMRIEGTDFGYPIVDSVVRLLPHLAHEYKDWLNVLGLKPPALETNKNQELDSVDSFGFQWSLVQNMRTEKDLEWRVCTRYGINKGMLANKLILDAGAGAGDQSKYMLVQNALVVSIDLSNAIDVVAKKCRSYPGWCGIQGDITSLPFDSSQFNLIYCEGVIQHTRDSKITVKELLRVLAPGGIIIATHYQKATRFVGKLRENWTIFLRKVFKKLGHWKSLLAAGIIATFAHIPLLGRILVKSGTAIRYDLMPDFRTTWINTYDNLGPHSFQRYLSEEEFISFFKEEPNLKIEWNQGTTIRATKQA